MSRYKTYKPSGIDWIGEVPEHWERKRFRYCFENSKGLSITKENLVEYGIPCVNYGEIHSKYGFKVNPEVNELLCVDEKYLETNQSSILSEGDFVFADTSEDIEGSGNFTHLVGNQKIFAGYHTIISRLKIKSIPRFIAYYFESVSFRNQIRKEIQGVKVFSITNKILKDTILFLPEYSEQLTIANYLDNQTQKIDRLIVNKKAQAEKLKELRQIEINHAVTKGLNPSAEMKDSGIEWLGKIPKHWEKRKIATNFQTIGSGTTPDAGNEEYYDETGKYYFVNTGDLKDCEIYDCEKKITEEAFTKFTSLKLFPVNTLLIAMYGATIGKVGILKTEATTNQACCALANSYRFNIDYMFYFFIGIREDIIRLSYGGGQPNISQDTIKQLRIPCPPKDEQLQIVEHLQKRTTAIDQLIKNIEAQIEKLQELRKIKIYEAVTGKIKVNAYAETTA